MPLYVKISYAIKKWFLQNYFVKKAPIPKHENFHPLNETDSIQYYFEHFCHQKNNILITGWAVGKTEKIKSVGVFIKEQERFFEFEYSVPRPDLFGASRDLEYAKSGFVGHIPWIGSDLSYEFRVIFESGIEYKQDIPKNVLFSYDKKNYQKIIKKAFLERKNSPNIGVRFNCSNKIKRRLFLYKYFNLLPCKVITSNKCKLKYIYCFQLDPDADITLIDILEIVHNILEAKKKPSFIYWDERGHEDCQGYFIPHFKPDFSKEYLLSWNYIGYSFAYLWEQEISKTNSIKHPIALLSKLEFNKEKILHIPSICSSRKDLWNRNYILEKNVRNSFLAETSPENTLEEYLPKTVFTISHAVKTYGYVSIIIPFKDQSFLLDNCLRSIYQNTHYTNFEIILVDNLSTEKETFDVIDNWVRSKKNIKLIPYPKPFNYAALHNEVIREIDTDYILLLNNDIEILTPTWLNILMSHAVQKGVGVVGAKLLYPYGGIQHIGIGIGMGGVADHFHKHLPKNAEGYFYRAQCNTNALAVTGACLLISKNLFLETNGFDEVNFATSFNDVDLCLNVYEKNLDIVCINQIEILHHESVSRGYEKDKSKEQRFKAEQKAFAKKWGKHLENKDPFYSKNFSNLNGNFILN